MTLHGVHVCSYITVHVALTYVYQRFFFYTIGNYSAVSLLQMPLIQNRPCTSFSRHSAITSSSILYMLWLQYPALYRTCTKTFVGPWQLFYGGPPLVHCIYSHDKVVHWVNRHQLGILTLPNSGCGSCPTTSHAFMVFKLGSCI